MLKAFGVHFIVIYLKSLQIPLAGTLDPCYEFIVMFVQDVQRARITSVMGQRAGSENMVWKRSRYEKYSPI